MEILKRRFAELIKDVSPSEISELEQSLIEEGMPESKVKRLYDVHVEMFKQSLNEQTIPHASPGHPVHTFMMENRESEKIMDEIYALINKISGPLNNEIFMNNKEQLEDAITKLSEIDKHYLRKENQLFPLLESHDVAGPTRVMWAIHDDIRTNIKNVKQHILLN